MSGIGRNANQVIIYVNVTFTLNGPTYNYVPFNDGSPSDDITVAPGDQVAWVVRVEAGTGVSTPAYELTFSDSSIFGTKTISVPQGGLSGFFTVVSLSTGRKKKKYSLAVSGISKINDPQIQVDPNGTLDNLNAQFVQHNVRWTVASNTMEYQNGANPWVPFPPGGVQIAFNDKVQFFAVLTPPPDFEIIFPVLLNPLTAWPSPFNVLDYCFPATTFGALESTDNLTVYDQRDKTGTKFKFQATLTDGSKMSDPFTLILS
jgi:hypothetical protein